MTDSRLGGLAAAYTALEHPELFRGAVVFNEFVGGHDLFNWRQKLPEAIAFVLGQRPYAKGGRPTSPGTRLPGLFAARDL